MGVSALFSPDGTIPFEKTLIIWFFDLSLIGLGVSTILYRNTEIITNIYLSICSLLLILIVIELYFGLFDPQKPWKSEHDSLFEYNSIFGWTFIPHNSGRVALSYEHETNVVINSVGMRDREYTLNKPEGVKRIVVIGDSFTSGLGVDAKEVFTEVMEDSLLSNVEVLNFGVNGFGPTQEFLMLKYKGLKYDPDIVIMVLYIRNDFDDIIGKFDWNRGYQRPRAILHNDGEITFENIPVPPPKKYETAKPRQVIPLPTLHLLEFIKRRNTKNDIAEVGFCKKEYSTETTMAYNLMKAIMKSAGTLCRENGVEFLVVVAPTIVQVYENKYWPDIKRQYNLNDDLYDLYLPNKELERICAGEDIRILDLTPTLKSHAVFENDLYYSRNKHWKRFGHSVVAKAIANYLIDNSLLTTNNSLLVSGDSCK